MAIKFRFKPISESDGRLVILTDGSNQISLVDLTTGEKIETGRNVGPGNGYGGTFRFSKPGSAYNNVAVVNEAGQVLYKIGSGAQSLKTLITPQGSVQDLLAKALGANENKPLWQQS
jgi:hypothetical protein